MKFIKTWWHNLEGPDKGPYYLNIKKHPVFTFSLSSLQLLKYHPAELYTDAEGFEMVKKLNIPFTKINIVEKKSSVYKSVNDLHVLSLQEEPAVLVDDNILFTDKIEISSKPSVITVLGIEMNSLKLVKSLVKTRRIIEGAPFPDDTLWKDKMAYIDSSLISVENGGVIREYFCEVQGFINKYSSELPDIEYTVLEDFIRRFWLYGFMRSKGIEFESYYKKPLEVILMSVDEFGFSQKNVVQHIIKIMDHRFSDALFDLHFSLFFRLYYKETFDAIEQVLHPGTREKQKTDSYLRVKHAYRKLFLTGKQEGNTVKNKKQLTLKAIKEDIATNYAEDPSCRPVKFLDDIYEFETYLDKANKYYLKNNESIASQQLTAFEKILKFWDAPVHQFEKLKLTTNPYFFFTESGWKWNTRWVSGVQRDKVAELKVIYNVHLDHSYYITGFLPDPEKKMAFEFNIDKLSANIINYFSEENSIADFYEYLLSQEENMQQEMDTIKQRYYNRVKDLLLINILCINEE